MHSVPVTSPGRVRPRVVPSAGGDCTRVPDTFNIGQVQRVPGNSPTPFFDFLDCDPCHRTERFPFDRDHRIGEIANDLLLLLRGENVFQDMYIDERHDDVRLS